MNLPMAPIQAIPAAKPLPVLSGEEIAALQSEVRELAAAKNAVILAHNYQVPEVQDVADYVGDSLGLAREAAKTDADVIVFAGVHFMAETAAIVCPGKTVLIPDPDAGCSLASSTARPATCPTAARSSSGDMLSSSSLRAPAPSASSISPGSRTSTSSASSGAWARAAPTAAATPPARAMWFSLIRIAS